jgi:putative membrane protein
LEEFFVKFLFLILKGMAIGGANIMPGVSGATLAVIFRIYDKMIASINNLLSDMKNSLKFLAPIGIGMVLGIFIVGIFVSFLLENFSLQTGGFIAGLMAGSLPLIYGLSVSKLPAGSNLKKYYVIAACAAAFIIGLTLLFDRPEAAEEAENLTFSIGFAAQLFFGGAIAAAAMVVPGISGAMVFVLFGLYPTITHTISLLREYLMSPTDMELFSELATILAPLGLGIIVGILLGSKIIALLLEKFHSATYFAIYGLVVGTIFAVFNDSETYQSVDTITPALVVFTVIAFIAGAIVSLKLGRGNS